MGSLRRNTRGRRQSLGGSSLYTIGLHANVGVSASNSVVSAWGLATTASGSPLLVTDSVTGLNCVRFDTGDSMVFPAGALNFASQAATSFIIAFRQRKVSAPTSDFTFFDSTNGGTQAGVQLVLKNNVYLTNNRQLIGRVYDGVSWIVDYTSAVPSLGYQALMWTVGAVTITSTSLTVMIDGYPWLNTTFAPITFPSGAAAAGVIGNFPGDLFAFEVYAGGLSVPGMQAATQRQQSQFSIPFRPTTLWTDSFNGEDNPAGYTLSDNSYVAFATKSAGPAGSTNLSIQARFSPDGVTWTPAPGADGSLPGLVLPFTATVYDSSVTQLSDGSLLAVANETTALNVRTLKAVSIAAAQANTWTNETVITQGSPGLEICASNPTEDPAHPGHVYICTYRGPAPGPWDGYFYKSTDYGVTWAAPVKFADATADGIGTTGYAEPGLQFVTAAAAAKYPDLTAGHMFFFIRADADFTMYEFGAATSAGPFVRTPTNLVAYSAARFRFLADGLMVPLQRDAVRAYNTLYQREGVVTGTAHYTNSPDSLAPVIMPSILVNGIGEYGSICKEVTPSQFLVITGTRLDTFRCDSYARFWPEWQLYGQMPLIIAPPTPQTITSLQTQQYTARGAGNFVWSIPSDTTGSSVNASTGVLTAGSSNGSGTLRVTDLNGYFQETTFTVTGGASIVLPTSIDASNLTVWWDPTQGLGLTGSQVNTWTSADGSAKVLSRSGSPQVGTGLNGKASIDLNGTSDYFTDLVHTLADLIAAGQSWTFAWVNKDTGSPADTGLYFFNSCILEDGANGNFAVGTTASTAYAGQDGTPGHYESIAQTTGTVNYYVAQYDVGTGKIALSKNGGAFSAGTSVSAIPSFTGNLFVGKNAFTAAYSKGSIGNIAAWKSKLIGANLTNLQNFLASTI